MKPRGMMQMNAVDGPVPADATIIVSGPPRGGTSFVAAALHAAGLWLGDLIDHTVFEDIELSTALREGWIPTRYFDWPLFRPVDSGRLRRLVAQRNATFPKWGFKRPDIALPLVGRSGEAIFRNPRAVMIFRDPVSLAERMAISEGLDMRVALREARMHTHRNLIVARHATMPIMVASYEKAMASRGAFYDELFAFCGFAIDPAAYPRIDAFVDTAGRSYLQVAAGRISGYINRYTDGVLYGWCRVAGRKGPETVEIYAADQLVASGVADQFRPVLRNAGIGHGRHGFAVRLDHLGLSDDCRIRAKVSGLEIEITNGGRTLGELRSS